MPAPTSPVAPITKTSVAPPPTPAKSTPAKVSPATAIHTDPQPMATQVKPGLTDKPAHHLHAAAQHRPTALQIERRAYDIWQRRGGGDGNAAVDWLQAERELFTEITGRNAD